MFKRFEENYDMDFIEEVLKTAVIIAVIVGIVVFTLTMIFIEPVEAASYEEYSSFDESSTYSMYDWVIQKLGAEESEDIGEEEEYDTYSSESITPVAKVIGKGMIIPKRNIVVVEHSIAEPAKIEIEEEIINIQQQNWNTNTTNSDEDYYYLLCAIVGEAQCCSWEEQIYVGSVILNRVNSKWFSEDTIKEVCLAKNQYACFWGENPLAYREPTETNKKAAQFLIENGSQLPKNVIFQALFEQGDGVYIKMDSGTYFCYKNE